MDINVNKSSIPDSSSQKPVMIKKCYREICYLSRNKTHSLNAFCVKYVIRAIYTFSAKRYVHVVYFCSHTHTHTHTHIHTHTYIYVLFRINYCTWDLLLWLSARFPCSPATFAGLTLSICYYRPQRSCGQSNVFTGVCDSVHRGGGVCFSACWDTRPPPREQTRPPGADPPPKKQAPAYGQ